jgi:MFS family permease
MPSRWTILAVLFLARAAMAFQFQSVAAIAPELGRHLNMGLADLGILIGLYFAPGLALALPGGAIGRFAGDKATVLLGLLLMLAGEALAGCVDSWTAQIAARLIAGTGGVLVNVLMTKMVADWFAGREIATAMAIFVNSWPAGLAVALVTLPTLQSAAGLAGVHLGAAAFIAAGFALVAILYRTPDRPAATPAGTAARLPLAMASALVIAGAIWSLYNIGLAMVFSFAPSMLVERGWTTTAAGSSVSIVLWLAMLSVPLGGFLADRTKRGPLILVAGSIAFALLTFALPRVEPVLPVLVAIGALGGLPAGAIMSLPAQILKPETRALGMGLFYTVFYGAMLAAPSLGGMLAGARGSASAALDFGSIALLGCPLLLWTFQRRSSAILGRQPAMS